MGKRKSSSKPQGPKKADPLPTSFTCLFCNHEKSVAVKLDKKLGIGQLECKVCGQKFQCGINYLSAPVDVYGEWVDAAEAVAKDDDPRATARHIGRLAERDEEPERRDANGDAERRYEGEGIVGDDEFD